MIIHPDTPNRKPIEQKVHELILKKLYVKVDDELIFIDKEDFVELILTDVITIAKADFDIDDALEIALQEQERYQSVPDTKRMELEETLIQFEVEIDAYQVYLEGLEENISEEEIFFEVLLILNSETELVDKRLHELMMQSLARRVSEEDAKSANIDRWGMIDVFANQVKLIASNETIDEAVEEAFWEFEDYPKKHLVKKESMKDSLVRFAPFAKDEINAYKFALSLQEQDAEIPMILGTVRQLLGIED